jgi:muramoyltetrapeptide carboxypeptidase
MLSPSYLTRGNKIAIIATARKITKEELKPAVGILESWGLNVVTGKNLFESSDQYSGTDEQRASDLQWALDDPEIKAILIARGGYGTVRIIDQVDFSAFRENPKWVIGYSDVTVLHQHINQNFKIATLHATMAFSFTKNEEATSSIRTALFGEELSYSIPSESLNREGQCEGEIVGGNLSLLYALSGSSSDLDTSGKILFIEDLDEYLYHLDRMMMNLKRSGKLDRIKGLIVGGMSDMKDNAIPFGRSAEQIVLESVKQFDYPVCFNFPAGHVDRNLALFFGRRARMSVGSSIVTLKYL